MSEIKFCSKEHQTFFLNMMEQSMVKDSYHRAFFYVIGIAEETRRNIHQLFNMQQDYILPEGLNAGWQTSGTRNVCSLAFNLWNGYIDEKNVNASTPDELFCCGYAPYLMEGIKMRYPEYFRESKRQANLSR